MKRMLFLLLAVLMLVLAPTMLIRAEAAEIVDSGTCGENLTWTLDDAGTLTISGSGDMEDYYYYNAPWGSQRDSILFVVVEDGVTGIGDSAFYYYESLIGITLPESLTSIGDSAFYDCGSLTKITIPEGVTSIGNAVFCECESLNSITIPEGVTSIGDSAFEGCMSLRSITIPGSVTSIGDSAFNNCDSLSSITLPAGVTSIGEYTFANCGSLSSITLPESLTSIGERSFAHCASLTSITIPVGVTKIGDSAFFNCASLTSITIPGGVTIIGDYAFYYCEGLRSVTILEGVTGIGDYAFEFCYSLSSITLPESILLARDYAFGSCWCLNTVHYAGTQAQKAEITVLSGNENFTDATWHYECDGKSCPEPEIPPTEPEETKPTTPPTGEDESGENPFADVVVDAYYAAPVLWAVENGITNGLSADTFGPENTCTRGQIVTFLWRAKGSPEPKMSFNPFSDVRSGDYFYKAVLWAVENGITSGMGDGTFSPNAGCTRGQVVTFLWRSKGQPIFYYGNVFSDIGLGAYYYDAVLWAVENEITNGMGDGTFAPDATCTRGQIVTFLHRAMN